MNGFGLEQYQLQGGDTAIKSLIDRIYRESCYGYFLNQEQPAQHSQVIFTNQQQQSPSQSHLQLQHNHQQQQQQLYNNNLNSAPQLQHQHGSQHIHSPLQPSSIQYNQQEPQPPMYPNNPNDPNSQWAQAPPPPYQPPGPGQDQLDFGQANSQQHGHNNEQLSQLEALQRQNLQLQNEKLAIQLQLQDSKTKQTEEKLRSKQAKLSRVRRELAEEKERKTQLQSVICKEKRCVKQRNKQCNYGLCKSCCSKQPNKCKAAGH